MAENKTQKSTANVEDFLDSVEDDSRRNDAVQVAKLMERVTGEKPRMWGSSIIGFGDVHLKYASGREIDYFRVGLSPRKASLTLYMTPGFTNRTDLLADLGKHTTGKGCLYIKSLEDVDMALLERLIRETLQEITELES